MQSASYADCLIHHVGDWVSVSDTQLSFSERRIIVIVLWKLSACTCAGLTRKAST